GIRILADELETLRNRGVSLRVITTTYRGATERRALDELVRKFGAEVRIRYDAQSTRLHAKAWLFRRDSGFDTGYVGSSNLSKSALLDGLEWNVRISAIATPVLVRKFEATFDTYWNDPDFRHYDPERDAELLDRALATEGGFGGAITLSGLEVRPRPHQERILEALAAERAVHDRHRNLVVAATGTGKTVVAALDYQRLRRPGQAESLLFIAHRKEILDQALRTYREVLADGTYGEPLVAGQRPQQWRHVFASVQSVATMDQLPQFDVVVIDEFHHAEAATYRRLLDRLHPSELLGLTATPERSDGSELDGAAPGGWPSDPARRSRRGCAAAAGSRAGSRE
ncbi:MAG: DEAD/DEAH box helicase family protein, partial [Pseudonocardiaceae bacterium]